MHQQKSYNIGYFNINNLFLARAKSQSLFLSLSLTLSLLLRLLKTISFSLHLFISVMTSCNVISSFLRDTEMLAATLMLTSDTATKEIAISHTKYVSLWRTSGFRKESHHRAVQNTLFEYNYKMYDAQNSIALTSNSLDFIFFPFIYFAGQGYNCVCVCVIAVRKGQSVLIFMWQKVFFLSHCIARNIKPSLFGARHIRIYEVNE